MCSYTTLQERMALFSKYAPNNALKSEVAIKLC